MQYAMVEKNVNFVNGSDRTASSGPPRPSTAPDPERQPLEGACERGAPGGGHGAWPIPMRRRPALRPVSTLSVEAAECSGDIHIGGLRSRARGLLCLWPCGQGPRPCAGKAAVLCACHSSMPRHRTWPSRRPTPRKRSRSDDLPLIKAGFFTVDGNANSQTSR